MMHKVHFIRINPLHIASHVNDGFVEGKKYEVVAIDHQNRQFYIYNDLHAMIPIPESHCVEIPEKVFENSSSGGFELL